MYDIYKMVSMCECIDICFLEKMIRVRQPLERDVHFVRTYCMYWYLCLIVSHSSSFRCAGNVITSS